MLPGGGGLVKQALIAKVYVTCHCMQLTNLHGHLGRLCVALLRSSPNNPGTGSRAADAGARLTQLAALLDNYLHPSNTGMLRLVMSFRFLDKSLQYDTCVLVDQLPNMSPIVIKLTQMWCHVLHLMPKRSVVSSRSVPFSNSTNLVIQGP
jgi:hypothetical protein